VLVSLAVIFVPMVFDEPHSERTSTSINIPEEPPFPEVESPKSDIAQTPPYQQDQASNSGSADQDFRILENDEPEPATQPETSQPATPKQTESPANAEQTNAEFTRSLEGAWVVQLGSFGNGDNARRLRDSVREKGYGSHLQEVVRGDSTLTRVFSGPFAEKTKAESAKRALDEAFSLNSLVTSGDK